MGSPGKPNLVKSSAFDAVLPWASHSFAREESPIRQPAGSGPGLLYNREWTGAGFVSPTERRRRRPSVACSVASVASSIRPLDLHALTRPHTTRGPSTPCCVSPSLANSSRSLARGLVPMRAHSPAPSPQNRRTPPSIPRFAFSAPVASGVGPDRTLNTSARSMQDCTPISHQSSIGTFTSTFSRVLEPLSKRAAAQLPRLNFSESFLHNASAITTASGPFGIDPSTPRESVWSERSSFSNPSHFADVPVSQLTPLINGRISPRRNSLTAACGTRTPRSNPPSLLRGSRTWTPPQLNVSSPLQARSSSYVPRPMIDIYSDFEPGSPLGATRTGFQDGRLFRPLTCKFNNAAGPSCRDDKKQFSGIVHQNPKIGKENNPRPVPRVFATAVKEIPSFQ